MKVKFPKKTDQQVSREDKAALIELARTYIGVRWIHLGRDRNGLDCGGLLIACINERFGIGIKVYDYSPWPNPAVMRQICNQIFLPISRDSMEYGDIALMYAQGLGVVHLGWYAENTLIHASNEPGVKKVIETTIHPDWLLRGAFAVPVYEV